MSISVFFKTYPREKASAYADAHPHEGKAQAQIIEKDGRTVAKITGGIASVTYRLDDGVYICNGKKRNDAGI